jgi:transcriptional regulator with XRE-family HTH domain
LCRIASCFLGTFVPDIAERIREERERLGHSQPAFAELCGVGARSQRNYESGERLPDAAYLAGVLRAGADVLYILTGERSKPVPASVGLPRDQQALIHSYEMCSGPAKKTLLQTAALLAAGVAPAPAPPAPTSSFNQTSHGQGAVQIGSIGQPPAKRRK